MRHDGVPGATYLLTRDETICGRSAADAILPNDATISPRHMRVILREPDILVEDLGSANGTFLQLREPLPVGPGDEIRIGRQLLRVERFPRDGRRAGMGEARSWGSPDRGSRLRLVQLLEGGGTGEVFPLREGGNTIGRETGDITCPLDRFVSARHARLELHDESATLTDVGSSNGTFIRISRPTRLRPGDQLLVGMQLLRLEG